MSSVRILRDERQSLEAAEAFARQIAVGVRRREKARNLSEDDQSLLAHSGLLGINVPREHGGAGVSVTTLIEVVRLIASIDPSVAHTLQSHYSNIDRFARLGTPYLRHFFFARVLDGQRLGNASSERGGPTAGVNSTALSAAEDGTWRLNGNKFYATGALTADWIAVRAVDPHGLVATAFVERLSPGIGTANNWNSMGQRGTASGSVSFDAVVVGAEFVQVFAGNSPEAQLNRAITFLIHGAIQAGIAVNALHDGAAFVTQRARPHPEIVAEGGAVRVAEDPYVLIRFGQLATRVHAAEALVLRASRMIDQACDADGTVDPQRVGESLVAMGEAKAFAADVALEVSNDIFGMAGSSAADESLNLNRHWRNARTHSLHDSVTWKYQQSGRYLLHGQFPSWTPFRAEP
jgi:alkylation response protein AidB-like acyl-CoA dehydrogenase